jgi:hypothetical protein
MCGQAAATMPYTIRSLSAEFVSNVRKLDVTSTFFTCVELLAEPGDFLRRYLAGRRVGYVNPFKFYLYSFLVEIILLGFLLNLTGDAAFNTGLAGDAKIQILALISTAFWGIFWAFFYRGDLNSFAEYAACTLYFVGQNKLLGTLIIFLSLPFREGLPMTSAFILPLQLLVMVLYGYYFARELFRESLWKIVIKQTLLFLIYLVMLSAMVVGYGGWLNLVGQR